MLIMKCWEDLKRFEEYAEGAVGISLPRLQGKYRSGIIQDVGGCGEGHLPGGIMFHRQELMRLF
jgi:hypothetical protein